jgi:putative membrane protein
VSNSGDLIDFAIWGVIALVAQIISFSIVRFVFMPKITTRIENNEVSAGIVLGATNVAVGLINAACMTY